MEEKHNNATPQRPEGARPLDANLIPIDLQKYSAQLKTEEAYAKNGKNAITVFKSDRVTITLIALKERETVHPGSEESKVIMSLQVISGNLTFESMGKTVELGSGGLITLHQLLSFNATALSESICLLTMFK
jgi:hypothetical protein